MTTITILKDKESGKVLFVSEKELSVYEEVIKTRYEKWYPLEHEVCLFKNEKDFLPQLGIFSKMVDGKYLVFLSNDNGESSSKLFSCAFPLSVSKEIKEWVESKSTVL